MKTADFDPLNNVRADSAQPSKKKKKKHPFSVFCRSGLLE